MDKIEKHAKNIINDLKYNIRDRIDLKVQFIDHMNLIKKDYLEQGLKENEAINLAIKDFGDGSTITTQLDTIEKYKSSTIEKLKTISFILSFTLYSVFLATILLNPMRNTAQWVTILKRNGSDLTGIVNIIPFKTIIYYMINIQNKNLSIVLYNVFGKILLFVPFGLLIPLIFNYAKRLKNLMIIMLITNIVLEIIRFIFSLGVSNIDNIIQHILGGLIGYYMLILYNKLKYIWLSKNIKIVHGNK